MKVPFVSILCGALAIAVYFLPGVATACVLDRVAIQSGQWWRIVTGHWVHFSRSHLWLDTLVFVAAGALVESRSRRTFLVLLGTAAVSISLAVLVCEPELRYFGGLSGLAVAMLLLASFHLASRPGVLRIIGVALLLLMVAKLFRELANPEPLFAHVDAATLRNDPLSHVVGMVVALAIWSWKRWREATRNPFMDFQLTRGMPGS